MKIGRAATQSTLSCCYAIRRSVFIEEQGVPEAEEWDTLDAECIHFLAWDDSGPVGTARILPKGKTAKVQRVAIVANHRGTGLGLKLMRHVLRHARDAGFTEAALDAQTYAIPFYEKLGFVAEGPEFDDAGMPHREMKLSFQPARNDA